MTEPPSESTPEPTFVFIGVVERLAASNVREAPRSESTVVTSIERVLVAPPAFADLDGEITVLLPPDRQVELRDRRTFHCIGWIIGSGVALRALDVTAPEEPGLAARAAADPAEALVMQRLSRRVTASDLIVTGSVTEVRSVQSLPPEDRPVSEHDPDWHEAIVQVDSVSKGTAPPEGVVVGFPLSRDVVWRDSPKFEVGQRGVWLLRTPSPAELPQEEAAALAARPYSLYTALDPLDFQTWSQAARVEALVGSEPSVS